MGKDSKKPISSLLIKLLNGYALLLSPWLGSRCRFAPSCSEYAKQAIIEHGAGKGLCLASKRICRCHPWGGQGYDPVPKAEHPAPPLKSNNALER